MKIITLFFIGFFMTSSLVAVNQGTLSKEPVVTAEKYLQYKHENGHELFFTVPSVILVCYQETVLDYILAKYPTFEKKSFFYITEDENVGILGGWGIGAPALANKVEQLIARGAKNFIAIGTAGTLSNHPPASYILAPRALAEDGVAHLYLPKEESFAQADQKLLAYWQQFSEDNAIPAFLQTNTWSFSNWFKESPADIYRVKQLGCNIVEMEAATLYGIGQEKGIGTLSLFVISDSITLEKWTPYIKEPSVRNNLNQLADWSMEFCQKISRKTPSNPIETK